MLFLKRAFYFLLGLGIISFVHAFVPNKTPADLDGDVLDFESSTFSLIPYASANIVVTNNLDDPFFINSIEPIYTSDSKNFTYKENCSSQSSNSSGTLWPADTCLFVIQFKGGTSVINPSLSFLIRGMDKKTRKNFTIHSPVIRGVQELKNVKASLNISLDNSLVYYGELANFTVTSSTPGTTINNIQATPATYFQSTTGTTCQVGKVIPQGGCIYQVKFQPTQFHFLPANQQFQIKISTSNGTSSADTLSPFVNGSYPAITSCPDLSSPDPNQTSYTPAYGWQGFPTNKNVYFSRVDLAAVTNLTYAHMINCNYSAYDGSTSAVVYNTYFDKGPFNIAEPQNMSQTWKPLCFSSQIIGLFCTDGGVQSCPIVVQTQGSSSLKSLKFLGDNPC